MNAIVVTEPGGPESMVWREVDDPVVGAGEVLIDVAASAVNRADLLQRQGFYPPPKGASDILGMECSGTIAAVGAGVTDWAVGDEVCALLAGGGYAEKVVVPAGQVLPVPDGVDLVTAAALPEVACTVHSNLGTLLHPGELLLVHGGSSGIGTFAIQYAVARGSRVAVTAGSAEKLARCRELGAEITVNYRDEDFVEVVGQADVVLDNMGREVPRPQRGGARDRRTTRRSRHAGRDHRRAEPRGAADEAGHDHRDVAAAGRWTRRWRSSAASATRCGR